MRAEEEQQNKKKRRIIAGLLLLLLLGIIIIIWLLLRVCQPCGDGENCVDVPNTNQPSDDADNIYIDDGTNNNNNGGAADTTTGGGSKPYYPGNPNTPVNCPDSFCVDDSSQTWGTSSTLPIFANSAYAPSYDKLAPGVGSSYNFNIINNASYAVQYNITFQETNPSSINMKYRLKSGGTYIIGNATTWVTAAELAAAVSNLPSGSETHYTLDWKWFEAANDTEIGKNPTNYSLKIIVYAEEI
jgi:hypothetical protein